jgi:hypothetical protein
MAASGHLFQTGGSRGTGFRPCVCPSVSLSDKRMQQPEVGLVGFQRVNDGQAGTSRDRQQPLCPRNALLHGADFAFSGTGQSMAEPLRLRPGCARRLGFTVPFRVYGCV